MKILASLLVAVSFLLGACSPTQVLNTLTPVRNLEVLRDVRYGDAERQVLDVYAPPNAENAPLVVFIHGGSWTGGDKRDYKFVGESFARAGYVTAVINYRLAPQHRYPDYIRDAAQAIDYLRDNASRFGADPDSIFVTGHSAGAFNAAEVVLNERWLREAGVPVSSINGLVGIAGPYDYDYRDFPSRNAFPEGSDPADILPSRHVRPDAPPTLLLTAGRDQVVGEQNAQRLLDALQEVGADAKLVTLPGADHYTIVGGLARRLDFLNPAREEVLAFLAEHR